ncbi:MAG: NUDIX hydrolase [Acidobacteria bacterium]|nr:MAG: NUDIX hydrolase [Acidobacteriota bacterium]
MRDDEARLLSRRRVYEGRLLKIDLDDVELPGGRRATLETIRHPGAAAALPFLEDGEVILIRQYRHAVGGTILEIPAGKLDRPGEPPDRCAAREVEEEVGVRPGRLVPLGSILTTPGFTDEVIWLFEAHDLVPAATNHDADEVIEPVTMPFGEAVEAVADGRIRDAKSVAAILAAAIRRR